MAQQRVGIRNGALFSPGSTLWNNLLAYYTADNTPNDALGTYNGTLVNGTTYGTGIINQGFSFDGVNDYVNMGDVLNFDGTTPFTFSFWINPSDTSYRTIIGRVISGSFTGYEIAKIGSQIRVFLRSGSGWIDIYVNCGITINNWYSFVVTYDGSKLASGIKIYSNGLNKTFSPSRDTLTGNINTSGVNFNLGSRLNGTSYFFNGLIDEVGVWDRVLSPTEVTELYNSGSGKQYPN